MENKYLQNEEALLAYAAKAITLMQLDEWASDSALEAEIVRSPAGEKRMKRLLAKARRAEKWAVWERKYKPMKRALTALAASLARDMLVRTGIRCAAGGYFHRDKLV